MRQSCFPVSGESRVPRPHICRSSPGLIVGRKSATQSMLGASKPVVRHSTFATYLSGPLVAPKRSVCIEPPLKRWRISARSGAGVSPVTTAHSSPEYWAMSCATVRLCATDEQNTMTLFLSLVSSTISRQALATIRCSIIAASTSSATNSPARTWMLSRLASVFPDFATSFERKPLSISSLRPIE